MSDIVRVGSPEGVQWDVDMGEGWGHQISHFGRWAGSCWLTEAAGEVWRPNMRLRICRRATSLEGPALPQTLSDIRHFLPS